MAVFIENSVDYHTENRTNSQGIYETVTEVTPISTTLFLMSLDRDTALADLQSKAEAKQKEVEELSEQLQAKKALHEKELQELRQQVRSLQRDIGQTREEESRAFKSMEETRAKYDQSLVAAERAKNQLQKLWIELGRSKMRELLGSKAEPPDPITEPKTAHERIADDEEAEDLPF